MSIVIVPCLGVKAGPEPKTWIIAVPPALVNAGRWPVKIDDVAAGGYNTGMSAASVLAVVNAGQVIWTGLALAVLLALAVVAVLLIRRYCRDGLPARNNVGSFTLGQLRQMRQREQLSDREYRSLRDQVIRESQDQ